MDELETSQRINRIIGQLQGIQRMISTGRECSDILQQISAVKRAIDGVSKELVIGDICQHLAESDSKRVQKMLDKAINL